MEVVAVSRPTDEVRLLVEELNDEPELVVVGDLRLRPSEVRCII